MPGGGRHNQKHLAIQALIGAKNMTEASDRCSVPIRTLNRWLNEPEFKADLEAAKSQMLNNAIDKMVALSFESVEGLQVIAKDSNAASSARVTAWRSILEFALRGMEQREIKDKLDKLELEVSGNE